MYGSRLNVRISSECRRAQRRAARACGIPHCGVSHRKLESCDASRGLQCKLEGAQRPAQGLLLIELFPKDVRIVRSWPRHGEMMAGLDPSFAAALFVGYHASTTNPKGVRAHTISSAHFTRVALNGTAVTEAELNAAYAGAMGVPIVFISGDDVAVSEVTTRLGQMESVITKTSLGFHSAESLTPAAACDKIYQGALSAVAHRDQRKPYVLPTPVTLDISFKNYTSAEIVAYLRSVERTDAHSIRFVGRDMAEIMDFIVFLDYYNPDMTP
jgi:D-amino peptidase